MSASRDALDRLRREFREGSIDMDTFVSELEELDLDTSREELWIRWSSQGLFDEPITQTGYTSFKNGRPREVNPDGER